MWEPYQNVQEKRKSKGCTETADCQLPSAPQLRFRSIFFFLGTSPSPVLYSRFILQPLFFYSCPKGRVVIVQSSFSGVQHQVPPFYWGLRRVVQFIWHVHEAWRRDSRVAIDRLSGQSVSPRICDSRWLCFLFRLFVLAPICVSLPLNWPRSIEAGKDYLNSCFLCPWYTCRRF